jgi:hypothetical protein
MDGRITHQSSIINHQSSIINHQPSIANSGDAEMEIISLHLSTAVPPFMKQILYVSSPPNNNSRPFIPSPSLSPHLQLPLSGLPDNNPSTTGEPNQDASFMRQYQPG